jgi:prevent-host-death family protein
MMTIVNATITTIGAFEAKNTLGSLLDRVEAGEEILITRHGKPSARLTQPLPEFDREKARAAAARIREDAKQAKRGPFVWEEWKALRDEGRR